MPYPERFAIIHEELLPGLDTARGHYPHKGLPMHILHLFKLTIGFGDLAAVVVDEPAHAAALARVDLEPIVKVKQVCVVTVGLVVGLDLACVVGDVPPLRQAGSREDALALEAWCVVEEESGVGPAR